MFTYLLLITGISMYVILYAMTRDKLNPQGIFLLLWYLPASLASAPFFYNLDLQEVWNTEMMLVVYLSGVAFFIPSILLAKRVRDVTQNKINFTNFYAIVFNSFMILSIIAFLFHFYKNGFTITMFSGEFDLKNSKPEIIKGLNYFELLIPYLSIVAFFELNFSNSLTKIRKNILLIYIFFALIIYSLLFNVSRGSLLVFFLALLYFYNRKYTFTWMKISTVLLGLLIAIGSFSFIRLGESSMVLSSYGEGKVAMLFSSIYTYVAYNYENLYQLIRADIPMSGGWYSWKFLLKPYFYDAYESNSLNLQEFDTLFFNARTYLYPFYHDLHFFGILIYPFLLGILISLLVRLSNQQPIYLLLLMSLQKAIMFTSFGNYFFGELVIFFPYIIIILIIYSTKIIIKGKSKI